MKRQLVVLAVLMIAIPLSTLACPADGKHEPPKPFDPKTAGDLVDPKTLTPIEKRLNAIIVPEIDFRCANIYDIIDFYDLCVKKHGGGDEKDDKSRVRLVYDEIEFGDAPPLLHFSSLKMPLLYALRLSCKVGMLKYRIKDNVVTVYKAETMGGPTTKSYCLKPRKARIQTSAFKRSQ
jgi:hypothetical protein